MTRLLFSVWNKQRKEGKSGGMTRREACRPLYADITERMENSYEYRTKKSADENMGRLSDGVCLLRLMGQRVSMREDRI